LSLNEFSEFGGTVTVFGVAHDTVRRHAATGRMNPDKLFDYLDGRLPDWERTQLEQELVTDPQLQRELAMARRIHAQTQGDSHEVLLENDPATEARGRKMALRVGTAFIVLMGLNVAVGLWLIARHESANPNRKLLETKMRDQITKSLQQAANSLTPPPLDVNDISVSAAPGKLTEVADQIIATAQRLGGTAIRGLPETHRVGVLVDLPANREMEFRSAIATIAGGAPGSPSAANAEPASQKKSFVIQIIEPAAP
jgi:hypothetical protein